MFSGSNQQRHTATPQHRAARAAQATARARRRSRVRQTYQAANALFNFNLSEFAAFLRSAIKWLILGALVGTLAGTASAIFLISLAHATQIRLDNQWLLLLLPLAGFITGWVYWHFGGTAGKGNNLVIDEVNNNQSRIPLRMAPFVLAGTVVTHLFGGSAGREGTAIQMGASLADSLQRLLHLNANDRRLMIMAGIAGGFGSVFGVPAAGFVFGMEVQNVGRIRYEGLLPCLVASLTGDFVTRALGAHHSHYPTMAAVEVDPVIMLKVAIAGVAFGLTSMLFIELIHGIKHILQRVTGWPPLYPLIGGAAIILMTLLTGTTDYLGLSLPLISNSVDGTGVIAFAFLLKLLFTTVTLGSGYYGGEVTPLLVIGSTLGFTMGHLLGVDPSFMACIGLVAVFAGASNTPLASAIMGIELVGGGSALYLFLGCAVAYIASGHRGIYATQQVAFPKSFGFELQQDDTLQSIAARQAGWLPPLPGARFESRLVGSVMSRHTVSIGEASSLSEIVATSADEGVRALVVVDQRHVVTGIITDNDLQRAGLPVNLSLLHQLSPEERQHILRNYEATAADIMTPSPTTISHTTLLTEAIRLMHTNNLKRLPVVDHAGHLMGILTRSDILRELITMSQLEEAHHVIAWQATLADVQLESIPTVHDTDNMQQALQAMLNYHSPRVIVTNHAAHPIGVITRSDLLQRVDADQRQALLDVLTGELSPDKAAMTSPARDIMTTPLIYVNIDDFARDALHLLMDKGIKRLPVVNRDGALVGMASRAGLLHVLINNTMSNA